MRQYTARGVAGGAEGWQTASGAGLRGANEASN